MLRILTYHRVADPTATPALDPGQVSATPDEFRLQVRHLASRYNPVGLAQVVKAFSSGHSLPRRPVLVTFDDAYRDFGEVAWPILREHGVPATLFVPTAYVGSTRRAFWWDRVHRARGGVDDELKARLKSLPPDEAAELVDRIAPVGSQRRGSPKRAPVLDWDELRTLRGQGVELGSHTHTHPALTSASDERIREELRKSSAELEAELGEVPRTICYPYGLFDRRVLEIAGEEGFQLGFTALDGLTRPGRTDPLQLPRTNITRRTSPLVFRVRMRPWFAPVDRWRHRHERRRLEEYRRFGTLVRATEGNADRDLLPSGGGFR